MRFIRCGGAQYALWAGILIFAYGLKQILLNGTSNLDQFYLSLFVTLFGAGLLAMSFVYEKLLATTRRSEYGWRECQRRIGQLQRRVKK